MAESQALFIDPVLRPGRFDHEIYVDFPDESARVEILSALTEKMKVEAALDIEKIAKSTSGFVRADLEALTRKAAFNAMKRIECQQKSEGSVEGEPVEGCWKKRRRSHEEIEKTYIIMDDFEEAAKVIQPASIRDGLVTFPNRKLEDVCGLQFLKDLFESHIVGRIKFPKDYEEFGVEVETRFLLYGPPGCGKTLIAKAVASEAGASFIHIKGLILLSKYVLQKDELAVQRIFSCARACSPCILFFEEMEDLTTRGGQGQEEAAVRLLNKVFTELDRADQGKLVYVICAANSAGVEDLDLFQLRKFGRPRYVPLPSPEERGLILTALGRKRPIDANVDLMAIGSGNDCENFSGSDLSNLMRGAIMGAIADKLKSGNKVLINQEHVNEALKLRKYEKKSESFLLAAIKGST